MVGSLPFSEVFFWHCRPFNFYTNCMKDIAWHPGRGFAGCRGHECLPDPTSRTGKARSWPRPRPRRGPRARALKWSRAAGMSALFRAHDRQRHGRCAMQGPRKAACRGAAQGGVPRGRGAAARTPWPPAKPRWGCIRTGTRLAGGTMRHRARAPESGDSPARASRQRACAAVAAAHAEAEPPRQRPPSRARAARGGPRPSRAHRGGLAPDPPGDRAFARLGRLPALPPGGPLRGPCFRPPWPCLGRSHAVAGEAMAAPVVWSSPQVDVVGETLTAWALYWSAGPRWPLYWPAGPRLATGLAPWAAWAVQPYVWLGQIYFFYFIFCTFTVQDSVIACNAISISI
jgi:hypothetical protein